MGSKRAMLRNGLGELLSEHIPSKTSFYDLFCGAGSVAGYVAQNFKIPVYASDLQQYAVVLAASQIEKTEAFNPITIEAYWATSTQSLLELHKKKWETALQLSKLPNELHLKRTAVIAARSFCESLGEAFPLTKAYGGHYYSPAQAMLLDARRRSLPSQWETVTLAALIDCASTCAAAPGHTAQPFSTSDTALPHLASAWAKDISLLSLKALERMCISKANISGEAVVSDAIEFSKRLGDNDLAFIDPPYSEVQYSRFYHVLESIARGSVGDVKGVGRYPDIAHRPQSKFSRQTQSDEAYKALMQSVSSAGAQAIVTFPSGSASNGLSGKRVEEISDEYFKINKKKITSLFSTMGGNAIGRDARKSTTELILHLVPK
jgi:adenine-specific DNA methylase